jgi:hypothetical protein
MRLHTLLFASLPLFLVPAATPQKPADKAAPAEAAPLVSTQILAPIEQIAKQLAKGGREREVKDLLTALEKLGYPKANFDKLEKACKDDLAKAKIPLDSLPAGAKQLRTTARQIVAVLEKMPDGEPKLDMAKRALMLDGECEEAHKVLGHEKVGKSWVPSTLKDARKHRGEIMEKTADAKKLVVEVEKGEIDDPVVQKACGAKATFVRRGQWELRSNFSVEKTERILREVERAYALGRYLRLGDLQLPPVPKASPMRNIWVLIDSREMFNKFAADTAAAGEMDAQDAKLLGDPKTQLGGFTMKGGVHVELAQFETSVQAHLLVSMCGMKEGLFTPLTAGHLNWLTLTCFGCTLPSFVYSEEQNRRFGGTTVETEDQKREREELMRMAKAGIAGSRTWMQFLVEHGEDPSFANSFVQSIGAISGNDLHKCTSVVEFLQESDLFAGIYKTMKNVEGVSPVETYSNALKMPLGELEYNWRTWLMGSRPGVAERIDKENLNAWPKDALAVLEYMNKIREASFKGKIEGLWKLKFDPELSEQCALHAHYLTLHEEQQKWPDAHEEYADKVGYTVEGAWAGGHSVIVWGNLADYKEAVDVWMASFYHRLPLTDPGVLRLGWGSEDIYAVMDMSSLAAPYDKPFTVVYPYDGEIDVPLTFLGNEMPDPVPEGEAGSVNEVGKIGYPITIQTNPVNENGEVVDIDMKLYEGKDMKTEVECYFSTPSKPTNPELAPGGAWCLMPKAPLKAKTEFKVVANWKTSGMSKVTAVGKHMEWTFKTK